MLASQIPAKFQITWGSSAGAGFIRTVPQTSQINITPGAASFTDGFPPLNFSPVGSGGIPPFGQDVNGILRAITAWQQWVQAGDAAITYDSAFSSSIGGYPAGAFLASTTYAGGFWVSIVDNNTTNPDAGGTGWVPLGSLRAARIVTTSGVFSMNVNDYAIGLNRTVAPATSSSTLPSGAGTGQEFVIEDLAANFFTYPVVITPPAGTIAGLNNFTCNVNRQSVIFRYYGSNLWSVKS